MSTPGNNEITRHEIVTRASLRRDQPMSAGGTAVVFVDRRGRKFVADRPLTASEIWFDAPRQAIYVDVAVHPASLTLKLPSKEEAFFFEAHVELAWQIHDPLEAVNTKLTDGEPVYRPHVQNLMRRTSRQFGVEESAQAEAEINTLFANGPQMLSQGMVLVSCTVTLTLDTEAKAHIAKRTEDARIKENRERDHAARLDEQIRVEAEAKAEHRVAKLHAVHRQEIERMEEKHRDEIKRKRFELYEDALRDEQFGLIKIRLEAHPEDVDSVIALVMQQQALKLDAARGFLEAAMKNGVVKPGHVAVAVTEAAQVVIEGLRPPKSWSDGRREFARSESDRAGQIETGAGESVIDVEADESARSDDQDEDDYPL